MIFMFPDCRFLCIDYCDAYDSGFQFPGYFPVSLSIDVHLLKR